MAIPQSTIDQILDRTDLVDLIGQRVKLKKSGKSYSGCCPFHQEKTPSFHVYRDKGYYHCFGCQANGNAIRYLMETENRSFIDVLRDLAQRCGVELPKFEPDQKKTTYRKQPVVLSAARPAPPAKKHSSQRPISPDNGPDTSATDVAGSPSNSEIQFADYADWISGSAVTDEPDPGWAPDSPAPPTAIVTESVATEGNLYDLLEQVCQYYQQQLQHSQPAQQYFARRGLTADTIAAWRLGYAPEDWQHLEQAFAADIEGLRLLGLIRTSEQGRDFDLLRDRVIFPIRDSRGRVVGFGGRALNDEIKPKYINSPDSDLFHKNRLLYGLYEGSQARATDWLMVEGYMDVIALHQAGIHGAVATLGTASNADHLTTLFKRNPRLTLAFDGDQAGQKAAWRTLEIALPLLTDERELRFFILPPEHDPDSLITRHGVAHFRELWQNAPLLSDYLYARLTHEQPIDTPEGKSRVMGNLKTLTAQLPKGNYGYVLQQEFKQRLGFGFRSGKASPRHLLQPLNYEGIARDRLLLVFLLHYPHLHPHFNELQALTIPDTPLHTLLTFLQRHADRLPHDPDSARFFVLGGCLPLQDKLLQAIQEIDLAQLDMTTPALLERHAQALQLIVSIDLLQDQIKHSQKLLQRRRLKQQLDEKMQQLHRQPLQSS